MAVSEVSAVLDLPVANTRAEEMAEVSVVLASPLFQRAAGISQVLRYLSQMYFEGRSAEVKEYTIAVEALGRKPDFDPQSNAIVRVDLYHLRKRLQKYYETEGKNHAIHIQLPVGSYAPEFIHKGNEQPPQPEARARGMDVASDAKALHPSASELEAVFARRSWLSRWRVFWLHRFGSNGFLSRALFLFLGIALGALVVRIVWARAESRVTGRFYGVPSPVLPLIPVNDTVIPSWQPPERMENIGEGSVRILCGLRSGNYLDPAGRTWIPDQYFSGGHTFQRPVTTIDRSTEPKLYSSGREGTFQYDIPVRPGEYEVHLFFAETQPGILDGMREVSYTIAGVTDDHGGAATTHAYTIDVVTDAGGPNTATEKIYTHLHPGTDGKIHLSFWSQNAFLNALEVLPEPQGKPRRLLLSTMNHLYVDSQGNRWQPDQYFLGGDSTVHLFSPSRQMKDALAIFNQERYGNFSYSLPVAQDATYTLTLWMAERYWGAANSGMGGVGSRVFDVFCNGVPLLRDFDILHASPNTGIVTIIFHHLHPDAQGKLNLGFVPVLNYPLVNAIEVQTE